MLALAFSLLAHLLLLSFPGFRLPVDDGKETLIEARLEPLPQSRPEIRPKLPIKSVPKPLPKLQSKPQPKSRPLDLPEPEAPVIEPIVIPSLEPEAAEPAPANPEQTLPASPPEVLAESSTAAPPPPLNSMPGKAEIHYKVVKGVDGFSVGRAVYIWQVRGDRYVLTSITEGTGVFALFQPGKLVQISQGHITPLGLAPDDFWIQRGRPTPDKTAAAHFNYRQQTVTVGKMMNATTVPLLPGAQDILSVTFQLAMTAPFQGEQQLYVTTGKGLKPYTAQVVGDELLDTPLGPLRTLHLARKAEAGENAIDVWLALDYNNMPVKVRVDHRKLGIVEQVVSDIHMEY